MVKGEVVRLPFFLTIDSRIYETGLLCHLNQLKWQSNPI